MGLRQEVAVVVVVFITSQILSSHCMPRNQTKFPLKSYAKSIKSSLSSKRTKKEALCNKLPATNSTVNLEKIRFPSVEYPSDSEPEEYYRFLNEYPIIQFKSKNDISNALSQAQKCKMDTKYKRKLDMATNTNSFTEYDPGSQPYCFRRSDFFPEVEYPLSTRDMWIPKYWSRLQDAKRDIDLRTDGPTYTCQTKQAPVSNYDLDFETSALDTLIKSFSTRKFQIPTSDSNFKQSISNETVIGLEEIVSNNTSPINRVDDPKSPIPKLSLFDDIKQTTISTQNNASDPEPSERKGPYINITLNTRSTANDTSLTLTNVKKEAFRNVKATKSNSNINEGSVIRNDSVSTTVIMVNGSTNTSTEVPYLSLPKDLRPTKSAARLETETINYSEIQMPSSSGPIDKIATEAVPTTITITNPNTNVFTPLDYYDSNRLISFDINDITTVAPFEYMTSPMSALGILTHNSAISQPDQNLSEDAIGTTTPMPILSSIPPNNNYDYSIVTDDCSQNSSDWGDISKDWVFNTNDYDTCHFPEDSDDWIIYVDTENTSSLGNRPAWNCSLVQKTSIDEVINSTFLTALADNRNRSQEEAYNTQVDLLMPNTNPAVTMITILETGNDNITNFGTSSNLIENNVQNSAISIPLSNTTEYGQENEYASNSSVMVLAAPTYLDYNCILNHDIGNTTQGVALNEYAPYYFLLGVDTEETNNTMDHILYFNDANSTLQCEYIDDTMASFTEMPYDLVMNPEYANDTGTGFINDSFILYETICDCPDDFV